MVVRDPDDGRRVGSLCRRLQSATAVAVLVSNFAATEHIRSVEEKLQHNHLDRSREGLTESIETSSIHQETLRALKQVNTSFSMMGYPVLAKFGGLLNSRLA